MLGVSRSFPCWTKGRIHSRKDTKWNAVKVRIQAHPKLTPGQQDLVRSEYFEGTAARACTAAAAPCCPYLVQELRLALDVARNCRLSTNWRWRNVAEVRKWLPQRNPRLHGAVPAHSERSSGPFAKPPRLLGTSVPPAPPAFRPPTRHCRPATVSCSAMSSREIEDHLKYVPTNGSPSLAISPTRH